MRVRRSVLMGCFNARTAELAMLLAGVAPASATVLNWSNPAGGSASTAANWSPAQVPTGVDDLTFNIPGAYAVTFNASTTASRTHTFRDGTLTLTMGSPHTTSTGITVGDLNGDAAALTLATGTWNSTASVIIGDAAGSNGTLNVNDDDADLLVNGAGADLTVGSNAPGALSITGGGLVEVADLFVAGNNAVSTANVTVSGATATLPLARSTLRVLGSSQSRFGQGGDATINISNGGLADFAGDLAVALGSASTSTVTIAGLGGILPQNATLDVAGDVLLGRNTTGGSSAGAATLNVNADGRVLVGNILHVAGDPDGGTATLHTAAGAEITTRSLSLGAGATVDFDGGAINVDGGTLSNSMGVTLDINGGADHPVLTMRDGASAGLSPVAGIALRVGGGSGANAADFDVRSGAQLTIVGGQVQLGVGADDSGNMIINGPGSLMTLGLGSELIVGNSGSGRFEAELGGTVSGNRLSIARNAGSDGLALFENPDTTAAFEEIYVGGSSAAQGGAGVLAVNQNAVLSVPNGGTPVRVWPTGTLDITSAEMNVAGGVNCQGELSLQGDGVLNALQLQLSGDLVAHPNFAGPTVTVNASVNASATATIRASNGDLSIGNSGDPNGFVAAADCVITTGPNTITLQDADEAVVDEVVLAGGTLAAPNGISVLNNGAIDGNGSITTPELFFNSGGGVITATGANGITINGMLRNNSGTIDGTKFTFNGPDGGWTGAGAINAQAVFNSDTKINALANMSIGDGSNFAVTMNVGSELHADTRTVTLLDGNGVGLGSVTDFSGGHVVCAQPLVVNNGRRLSGRGGSVDAPSVTVFGRLSPGELIGEPLGETGELTINGDLILGANSNVDIEIGGEIMPIELDRVIVNGAVTLNGALNIAFINGYVPPTGTAFVLMEFSGRTGNFTTVNLPGAPSCLNVAVTDGSVVLTRGVAGDIDGDGDVDQSDLGILLSNFGCSTIEPPFCPGDVNTDGAVNQSDLGIVLSSFGQTCN